MHLSLKTTKIRYTASFILERASLNSMKPKILLTIGDITVVGGAERVVINLANAFSESGYEVEILSFYQGNKNLPYALNPQVKCFFFFFVTRAKDIFLKKIRAIF